MVGLGVFYLGCTLRIKGLKKPPILGGEEGRGSGGRREKRGFFLKQKCK